MDASINPALQQFIIDIDNFITKEITPLQELDDNSRFFDHRREDAARTGILRRTLDFQMKIGRIS